MTIGVIINPTAGRGAGREHQEKILAVLDKSGVDYIDFSSRSQAEAEARVRVAIAAQKIDTLIVAGGDGIAHLGVNLAMEADLKLGLVACGSGNDVALALGLPIHDVEWGTQVALDHLAIPRTIDIGKARSADGEFYFLGSVTVGLDSIVNARANKMRFPKGPSRYRWALYLELLAFKALRYKLVVDGEYHDTHAMLCSVTNIPSYGGGMKVTPEANINDGLLNLFVVHKISKRELIRVFPHVYTGTHVGHPAVEIVDVKQVLIDAGRTPVFADGEYVGSSPLEVQVLPNALRMLAPSPLH